MLKDVPNVHSEYWLFHRTGARFGPFYEMKDVEACVIEHELSDFELKTFFSYIPF